MTGERFHDRSDAGRQLAAALSRYANRRDVTVLALPRGGVPVGYEIARELGVELDVFLVRKLGVPGHEELAMGAIASGGVRVLNERVIGLVKVSQVSIDRVAREEQAELERREREYRSGRPAPELVGRTVILVDDGLATGSTMRAAAVAARKSGPAWVVIAVPTAPAETCAELQKLADEVVCLTTPEPFYAVGMWYEDFSQTSDDEVRSLLERAAEWQPERRGVPR